MRSFDLSVWRIGLFTLLAAVSGVSGLRAADDGQTPPVEVEAPAQPGPRASRFPQLLGIFRDAHLRAHETTDQVVAVFGDAVVEGNVRGQVVSIFGNATIKGHVGDQVVVVFGNGVITHDIDGDVIWLFGKLAIAPGVTIDGDFIVIGGETDRDASVAVNGERFEFPIPGATWLSGWVRECLIWGRLYRHDRPATWFLVGVIFALSMLLAALFRGPVEAGVSVLQRRPGLALVNGLLVVMLTPPATIVLLAVVVGIPVVPFLWVGLMFATWIGVIAVSRFCGMQIGVAHQPALAFAVGFGLFSLLFAVPVIGLLTWAGVMMLGVGTATTAWFESRRREPRANGAKAISMPPPTTTTSSAESLRSAATNPFVGVTNEIKEPSEPNVPSASVPPPATPPPPPVPSGPGQPIAAEIPPSPRSALSPALVLERVGFWPRIQATLLDLIMVGAALGITGVPFAFVYVWFAYHVAFWAWRGTTLGGVVMNLRIERLDGRPIDASVAIVRACGAIMSFVALGFGFLWAHWDPEKQSWHDKIAGTVIVRVPRGQALI